MPLIILPCGGDGGDDGDDEEEEGKEGRRREGGLRRVMGWGWGELQQLPQKGLVFWLVTPNANLFLVSSKSQLKLTR